MICRVLCACLWHLWPLFGTGCGPAPWLVMDAAPKKGKTHETGS
jgi:hypothetical protein